MEFDYSLFEIFGGNTILLVDQNLMPSRSVARTPDTKKRLCEVIDSLGAASARAQKLPAIITTSRKLCYTDQRVYLYIDFESEQAKAVGFIKVGTKKLFLYDNQGVQREVSPLCVLDFYVHESQQRKGYGRKLYQHMIQEECIIPSHLAVDKPSDKFVAFLAKHYKLRATIPQVNNYVVFDGFFNNNKSAQSKKRGTIVRQNSPELAANPMAGNRNRSGTNKTRSPLSSANNAQRSRVHARDITNQVVGKDRRSPSSSPEEQLAALADIPLARPSSREKLVQSRHSPLVYTEPNNASHNHQVTEPADYNPGLQQSRVPDLHTTVEHLPEELSQLAVSNGTRSQSAQNKAYSRHTNSSALPHQYSTSNRADYREPVLTRYGNPNVHPTDKLNSHQTVLNKQGHLKVTPQKRATSTLISPHKYNAIQNAEKIVQQEAGDWAKTFHSAGPRARPADSSWNVFGVPLGYNHIANRRPT